MSLQGHEFGDTSKSGRRGGVAMGRYCRRVNTSCRNMLKELEDRILVGGFTGGFLSSKDFQDLGSGLTRGGKRRTFHTTRALGKMYRGLKFSGLCGTDFSVARGLEKESARNYRRLLTGIRRRCGGAMSTVRVVRS